MTKTTPSPPIEIVPVAGLPELRPGDDLAGLIVAALNEQDFAVRASDIFVVAQKVVSKAEARAVPLETVTPSARALAWAKEWNKDARVVELIFREAKSILRMERGLIIAETHHGFVCANAGIDVSNAELGTALLLPADADASAAALQSSLSAAFGVPLGIIVSDSFGRAWREGLTNVALGVAGLNPLRDYRGVRDDQGRTLDTTLIAIADEIAAAAELVMGKTDRVPVAIVRGARLAGTPGSGRDLIRPKEKDLFR